MKIENKKILFLSPHTDDAEFGCGGTIHKLVKEGNDVHVVAFSSCRQSLRKGFAEDTLINEMRAASKELGLKDESVQILDFQVRIFEQKRQEILEEMIVLREKIQPELVFIPSQGDIHQDHVTVSEEAIRAFKYSSLFAYELPWNILHQTNTFFISVTDEDLQAKVKAIGQYKSQAHRTYADEEFIYSLARVRGVQANMPYCECYEVIRLYID